MKQLTLSAKTKIHGNEQTLHRKGASLPAVKNGILFSISNPLQQNAPTFQLTTKVKPLSKKIVANNNPATRADSLTRAGKIRTMDRKRINPKKLAEALKHFNSGAVINPVDFDRDFHKAHGIQDELLSTETTLDLAAQLASLGQHAEAQDLVRLSHATRVPTRWMGHNVSDPLNSKSRSVFQHPTSKKTELYAPTGTNHGTFNRDRRDFALMHTDDLSIHTAAVAYSLNYGMQPPLAQNSLIDLSKHQEVKDAHNLREDLKDFVRGGRTGTEVAADASWFPGRNATGRSVSPPRKRL